MHAVCRLPHSLSRPFFALALCAAFATAPRDARADIPPSLPAHFQVGPRIGRGGQATVYRARNLQTKRDVALRVAGDVRYTRGVSRAMRRSPWVARQLSTDGATYEELELLENYRSLGYLARIDVHPRRPAQAVQIVCNVLRGLEDLHRAGYVHRDLHAGNVMVDARARPESVRIVDFGLTYRRGAVRRSAPADDVFDAANLLVGLLTGSAPAMPAHLNARVSDVEHAREALPNVTDPALRAVLARAFSPEAGRRFRTARALREALEPFAETERRSTARAASRPSR